MNSIHYNELFKLELPQIPDDIILKLNNTNSISKIDFNEKEIIYQNSEYISETGITELPNKDYLVAINVKLPKVSLDMIDWWFWWQAQDDIRYQVWFPGEHKSIKYCKKYSDYFNSKFSEFSENIQYPTERIGKKEVELSIHFVSPINFGFNKDIEEQSQSKFICAYVGILKGLIQHTKMVHYFFEGNDGVELASRFWLGNGLPKIIKRMVANEFQAKEMAKHCWIEYSRLGQILPSIYEKEKES